MKRKTGKVCPVCKVWKTRDQFYISSKTGCMSGYCKDCNYSKHETYIRKHKEKRRKYAIQERARLLQKLWCQYGWRCARCGIDDDRVFQLDHINKGGRQERLKIGNRGIYRRAIKYPDEYQILCANCNMLKEAELNGFGN